MPMQCAFTSCDGLSLHSVLLPLTSRAPPQVIGAFRNALLSEAADAGKPLHALPRHAMVGVLRRFLGPTSYEREISDVLNAAYGAPPSRVAHAADRVPHAANLARPPRT